MFADSTASLPNRCHNNDVWQNDAKHEVSTGHRQLISV
jgi:hypothetical protein